MRTTLTLDEDVDRRVKDLARQSRVSFKEAVNATLRAGLSVGKHGPSRRRSFRVKAKNCGFHPGIDLTKLSQLLDELDAEDFLHEQGKTT